MSTILPRPELERVPPVPHGGHHSSLPPGDLLDFSANINPFGPSPRIWPAMQAVDIACHPGTKTTVADLRWLHERGIAAELGAQAQAGTPILGICGGYQMLGTAIYDPDGSESDVPEIAGLGLLPIVTHFSHEKQTVRAGGQVAANAGLFAGASDLPCHGYEIHMGRTVLLDGALPLLHITRRGEQPASDTDGAASADGRVAGTYMHGLFENNALRHALLANLAAGRGIARAPAPTHFDRAAQYDRLAAAARAHLDMARLSQIIERGITQ